MNVFLLCHAFTLHHPNILLCNVFTSMSTTVPTSRHPLTTKDHGIKMYTVNKDPSQRRVVKE